MILKMKGFSFIVTLASLSFVILSKVTYGQEATVDPTVLLAPGNIPSTGSNIETAIIPSEQNVVVPEEHLPHGESQITNQEHMHSEEATSPNSSLIPEETHQVQPENVIEPQTVIEPQNEIEPDYAIEPRHETSSATQTDGAVETNADSAIAERAKPDAAKKRLEKAFPAKSMDEIATILNLLDIMPTQVKKLLNRLPVPALRRYVATPDKMIDSLYLVKRLGILKEPVEDVKNRLISANPEYFAGVKDLNPVVELPSEGSLPTLLNEDEAGTESLNGHLEATSETSQEVADIPSLRGTLGLPTNLPALDSLQSLLRNGAFDTGLFSGDTALSSVLDNDGSLLIGGLGTLVDRVTETTQKLPSALNMNGVLVESESPDSNFNILPNILSGLRQRILQSGYFNGNGEGFLSNLQSMTQNIVAPSDYPSYEPDTEVPYAGYADQAYPDYDTTNAVDSWGENPEQGLVEPQPQVFDISDAFQEFLAGTPDSVLDYLRQLRSEDVGTLLTNLLNVVPRRVFQPLIQNAPNPLRLVRSIRNSPSMLVTALENADRSVTASILDETRSYLMQSSAGLTGR